MFCSHRSVLTERIVKYDANSAAKNISSLDSQMMVPTLTMLGRSWCPWRREAGMVVAVATGSLCPAASLRSAPGGVSDPTLVPATDHSRATNRIRECRPSTQAVS